MKMFLDELEVAVFQPTNQKASYAYKLALLGFFVFAPHN